MDWNEDGLKDLLVGETNGKVRYFRNIGTVGNPSLTFDSYIQLAGTDIDVGDYSYPSVNDWNEDGMKDLIIGGSTGKAHLLINSGTNANPVFNTESFIVDDGGQQLYLVTRSAPFVVDLDGDNLKDVVAGEVYGYVYFFKNNGTNANPLLADLGKLKTGTIDIYNYTTRVTTTDWDGDGQLDLVVGGYDCRVKRFLQTDVTPEKPEVTIVNNGGIVIPSSGGRLNYTIELINNTTSTQVCDVWTDVLMSDYTFYGPVVLRNDVSVGPASSISRDMQLEVPGFIPDGIYYYYAYAGDQETLQVYSQGDIYFYKTGAGDGGYQGTAWNTSGWENAFAQETFIPESSELFSAYPNPFNPTTSIGFALPASEKVVLTVYDLTGRQVATLVNGWRDAGYHEVTFDATGLASGVYLYRINAGDFKASGKMMLMK